MYYLFVFASLTRTQQGARQLNRAGVRAAVVRSPRGAAQDGCTHGVRVPAEDAERAVQILRTSGHPAGHLFLVRRDGTVQEVAL